MFVIGVDTVNIIGELNIFLDRAEKVKEDDNRLMSVLADMKNKYEIPDSVTELEQWEQRTLEADRIIKTYRYILSLKSD